MDPGNEADYFTIAIDDTSHQRNFVIISNICRRFNWSTIFLSDFFYLFPIFRLRTTDTFFGTERSAWCQCL
ncbi:hypothetical protein AKJ16_DCAP23423 [Drosera capensis]